MSQKRKIQPCGKDTYYRNIDAKLALMRIQSKDSSKRVSSEAKTYYCVPCRGYHLAGKKNWRENKASKKQVPRKSPSQSLPPEPRVLSQQEQEELKKINVSTVRNMISKYPRITVAEMMKISKISKSEIKSALRTIRKQENEEEGSIYAGSNENRAS